MTTAKKAFALSLAFHTFMALCAFLVLRHTDEHTAHSSKPMLLVTLSSFPPIEAPSPPQTPVADIPLKSKPAQPVRPAPQKQVLPDTATVPRLSEPLPKAVSAPAPSESQPLPPAAPSPVQSAPQPAVSPVVQNAAPKVDRSAEKTAFYASLRSRIQQQLKYPSAARRRGIEGSVAVRFLVDPAGTIRDVTVSHGEAIFHNAAKLAVSSASGIKIPETLQEDFPNTVELTLEFRLKGHS